MRGPESPFFSQEPPQQEVAGASTERAAETRVEHVLERTAERIAQAETAVQDAAKAKGLSPAAHKNLLHAFGGHAGASVRGKRWHGFIAAALIGFSFGVLAGKNEEDFAKRTGLVRADSRSGEGMEQTKGAKEPDMQFSLEELDAEVFEEAQAKRMAQRARDMAEVASGVGGTSQQSFKELAEALDPENRF